MKNAVALFLVLLGISEPIVLLMRNIDTLTIVYACLCSWGMMLLTAIFAVLTDPSPVQTSKPCEHGHENWDDCPVCGH